MSGERSAVASAREATARTMDEVAGRVTHGEGYLRLLEEAALHQAGPARVGLVDDADTMEVEDAAWRRREGRAYGPAIAAVESALGLG